MNAIVYVLLGSNDYGDPNMLNGETITSNGTFVTSVAEFNLNLS